MLSKYYAVIRREKTEETVEVSHKVIEAHSMDHALDVAIESTADPEEVLYVFPVPHITVEVHSGAVEIGEVIGGLSWRIIDHDNGRVDSSDVVEGDQ